MTAMIWMLLLAGLLIVAALAFYAGQLLFRLKAQNDKLKTLKDQRVEHIITSIKTIAFAMESEQCELSEGSIRVAVLLENLNGILQQSIDYPDKYPFIFKLYEKIKHMPTHDARKLFDKKEIRQMDREREGYEQEFKTNILLEVQQLKHFANGANAHST